MSNIILRNVNKTYPGGVEAVRDFSIDIADGEFVVLVGPSGCGKTTTLRMIAGLEDITSGEISIGGRVVNTVAPRDRDISMVFQSYALYPHMTVFQNMAYGLKLRKTPKAEIAERVRGAARTLEIEQLLDRLPKALSGGQRQRVALGRAMVREPKAFLFDEPLSNIDAKLRASTRVEIRKLHERLGATFVYVTHDQTEAMTMGDRIVVMRDGIIQQEDEPRALYDWPENMFTASFIGTPQINFLEGTLAREGDGFAVRIASEALPVPPEQNGAVAEYDGCAVTVGIRPENFRVGGGGLPAVTAEIEMTEPLGSETLLYAHIGGTRVIARAAPDFDADGAVRLGVDTRKMHLFDPETGAAITGEAYL
jgi:multiple sugar transport system ATP-binding protein